MEVTQEQARYGTKTVLDLLDLLDLSHWASTRKAQDDLLDHLASLRAYIRGYQNSNDRYVELDIYAEIDEARVSFKGEIVVTTRDKNTNEVKFTLHLLTKHNSAGTCNGLHIAS